MGPHVHAVLTANPTGPTYYYEEMDLSVIAALGAVALYVGAIVCAIGQIARTESLNPIEEVVWVLAVFCFPLIGAVVWFVAGPHPLGLRAGRTRREVRR